jgi:hypothetical protein
MFMLLQSLISQLDKGQSRIDHLSGQRFMTSFSPSRKRRRLEHGKGSWRDTHSSRPLPSSRQVTNGETFRLSLQSRLLRHNVSMCITVPAFPVSRRASNRSPLQRGQEFVNTVRLENIQSKKSRISIKVADIVSFNASTANALLAAFHWQHWVGGAAAAAEHDGATNPTRRHWSRRPERTPRLPALWSLSGRSSASTPIQRPVPIAPPSSRRTHTETHTPQARCPKKEKSQTAPSMVEHR